MDWVGTPRELNEADLTIAFAGVAHLAYHLGAIRQMNEQTRGPREDERGI